MAKNKKDKKHSNHKSKKEEEPTKKIIKSEDEEEDEEEEEENENESFINDEEEEDSQENNENDFHRRIQALQAKGEKIEDDDFVNTPSAADLSESLDNEEKEEFVKKKNKRLIRKKRDRSLSEDSEVSNHKRLKIKNEFEESRKEHNITVRHSKMDLENKYSYNQDIRSDQESSLLEQMPKAKLLMIGYDDKYDDEFSKLILKSDCPERILLRYGSIKNIPTKNIESEADWILDKLKKNPSDEKEEKKKNIIKALLKIYKEEMIDIPAIVSYYKYVYEGEFTPKEIWVIFEYDLEYQKFYDFKQKVLNDFQPLQDVVLNNIGFLKAKNKYIESAQNIKNLRYMEDYIRFLKEKHKSKFLQNQEKGTHIFPIKKSIYSELSEKKVDELLKYLFLSVESIVENIEINLRDLHKSDLNRFNPPQNRTFNEIIQEFKAKYNIDENISVISDDACMLMAYEMSRHPFIKDFIYKFYKEVCFVSTNPTKEGETKLDVFHQCFKTKRIKNLKVDQFSEYKDLYLDIKEMEKLKLIEVKFDLILDKQSNVYIDLTTKLKQAMNPENEPELQLIKEEPGMVINSPQHNLNEDKKDLKQYDLLRSIVIDKLLNIFMKDTFLKEIQEELKLNAEDYVIEQCAIKFYNMLMKGRHLQYDLSSSDKNTEELENNRIKTILSGDESKVMSFVYDPNQNLTYSVVLNKDGEVIEQKIFRFLAQRQSKFKNKNNQKNKNDANNYDNNNNNLELIENKVKDPLEIDREECQKIINKLQPNLIIIGANDLKGRYLKENTSIDVENEKNNFRPFGDLSVAKIYANSPISEKNFPNYDLYLKQAISLARFQQNPYAEILQLWNDDESQNYCLKLNLNRLQNIVDQHKLHEKLEFKAIEVVNTIGVDLRKACEFPHIRNLLNFVSGLGPRRAKKLAEVYKSYKLTRKREIIENKDLYFKKISKSALGFLFIRNYDPLLAEEYDLLDMTRIPLEDYGLAKEIIKIATKDQIDLHHKGKKKEERDELTNEEVKKVFKEPALIDSVNINDLKLGGSDKSSKIILQSMFALIKSELKFPGKDPRDSFSSLTSEELVLALINDDNFKTGQITQAKIIKIDKEHVKCKLPNELEATIWYNDIFETYEIDKNGNNDADNWMKNQMRERYKEGMVVEARIKSINFNNFKVDLITKPSELASHKSYIPEVSAIAKNKCFEMTELDKQNITYIKNQNIAPRKYEPRRIKHGKFANISFKECVERLKNKDIGECIFRPSSQGIDHLTLSYKFSRGIICHIDISETDKQPGDVIGKKLKIGNEVYTTLEEIVRRYVGSCATYIKAAIKNRKFSSIENLSEFDKFLSEEKEKNKSIINYNFAILEDFPGYIVLGYVPKTTVQHEYIKVGPNGLYFHGINHNNLDEIAKYFKVNFSNADYRDYVKKSVPPTVNYMKTTETNANPLSLALDSKLQDQYMGKQEETRVCNICGIKGHIARNCPQNQRNHHNNRYDNKRHNNYRNRHYDNNYNRDKGGNWDNNDAGWGNEKDDYNDNNRDVKKENENNEVKKEENNDWDDEAW